MKKSKLKNVLRRIAELVESVSSEPDNGSDLPGTSVGSSPVDDNAMPLDADALLPRSSESAFSVAKAEQHVYGNASVCDTDSRGHAQPDNRSPLEIVVDASEGFVPLWAQGVTLKWRFNARSMAYFQYPDAAKRAIRILLAESISAWGDAAPVRFSERNDVWDFEVVMMNADNCNPSGCVLASAFFPDAGRHELRIYPKMFSQPRNEWTETLVHEIGHVFGLRHFFAKVRESAWPSHVFGTHSPFSIMNYGSMSKLTAADKIDLKELYRLVWNGELTSINGTPIRLFRPYSESGMHSWK
jgi:hypothetical protein